MSFEKRLVVFNKFVHKYGRLPTELDPDYLEMLRMSKYRILAAPDYKPGTCANCGSAKNDGRQYIDFGLLVDFFGTVYLCGFCLKDISNEMGLFQVFIDEIGELKKRLLDIKVSQAKGTNIKDDILRIFEEVKVYLADVDVHIASDHSATNDSADVVPNKEPSKSESGNVESKSTPDGPKSRTIKSNSSERSSNLRSLTELLEADFG